jgi:2-dehydrotetronate isomerase
MPKFAANIQLMFNEYPFLDRFEAAKRAGFLAVECQSPYAHSIADLKRQLDRSGLFFALINTRPGDAAVDGFGLGAMAGYEREFQARVDQALEYAVALNVPKIHAMAGDCGNTPENAACFVRNIREAGEKAASLGKTILIEPLNPRDRPSYFLRSTVRAADFLVEIGLANVQLQFDAYHVQIIEGNVTHRFEQLLPLIGHVQIAGVPDRHEPEGGELDYPHFFRVLDASGYDGWVGAEYRPCGRTEDGLGWAKPYGVTPLSSRAGND